MSAGASLILALVEEARAVPSGGGGGGDGKASHSVVVADLRDAVIRQCWRTVRLQSRFEQKLHSLTSFVKVSENVPERAALDLARTRTVFFNLLNNAVLRASTGGWITWIVDYTSSSRTLQSTIQYCGEPVPENELQLLFPTKPRNLAQGAPPRQAPGALLVLGARGASPPSHCRAPSRRARRSFLPAQPCPR